MGSNALGKPLTPILVIFLGAILFCGKSSLEKPLRAEFLPVLSNSYNFAIFLETLLGFVYFSN